MEDGGHVLRLRISRRTAQAVQRWFVSALWLAGWACLAGACAAVAAMDTDSGLMVRSVAEIALPDPVRDSGFSVERALNTRRTVRAFVAQPLALAELSQLLWAAQGITNAEGLRTAPSAGALYPLEIYAVAGNVSGLEAGVYKYLPARHMLVRITAGDKRKALAAAALGQEWIAEAAAILVFSAVEERTTRKYGQRGVRYIYTELGHAAQNVLLQAVALGLGAAEVGAADDARVAGVVNMQKGEQALYLVPVGRPQHGSGYSAE